MENVVVPMKIACGVVLANSTVKLCKPTKVETPSVASIVKNKSYENILRWTEQYQNFTTYPNLISENLQIIPAGVEIVNLYEWKFRDPTDMIHSVIATESMYTVVNKQFTQMKYISSAAVIVDGFNRLCKIVSKTAYIPKASDIFYAIRMQDMSGLVINNLILGA